MTNWAEFWIKTARKYFSDIEIYLVTGGDGNPILGADFSAQTKMVAKYKAGIRITNQNDDYAQSFILTRLVASASRFYNAYFTTEEGLYNSPKGVIMRIFDAVTSGAKGAYFKTIIREDTYHTFMGNDAHAIGEPNRGAVNLVQSLKHLTLEEPVIDAAVLFPNTSIAIDPSFIGSIYKQSSKLRDVMDLDLVDENMIADGALGKYRFLLLLDGNLLHQETLMEIESWVKNGGIFIANDNLHFSNIGDNSELYQRFFGRDEGLTKLGDGYTLLYSGKKHDYLEFINYAVHNKEKKYPWTGIPCIYGEWDGVYATRFKHKIMYYNSNDHTIKKRVTINNLQEKLEFRINIEPYSIASVDLRI